MVQFKRKGAIVLEFVLNDYHRNISDDELLNDLLRVASLLDKDTLTKSEYAGRGNFHSSTIEHRFENWNKALDKAGLRHTKENRKRPDNADVSNDELLLDLRNQAARLGKDTITSSEYDVCGRHGKSIIISRFSSWENALLIAGLRPTGFHHYVPDADLYEEIERLWISLGRQPTSSDIKKGLSRFSLNTFVRRFGSWRGALQAFINWINDESFEHQKELVVEDNNPAFFQLLRSRQTSLPSESAEQLEILISVSDF